MSPSITIGIAGTGGDGVVLLGELLAETAASTGLHCMLSKSFGPQIRGGECAVRLTLSSLPLHCTGDRLDCLAVLDWKGVREFCVELHTWPEVQVFCDSRSNADMELLNLLGAAEPRLLSLAIEETALQAGHSKLARNMVLAGLLLGYLGWQTDAFAACLQRRLALARNSSTSNLDAIMAGHRLFAAEHAKNEGKVHQSASIAATEPRGQLRLMSGNQTLVEGVLAAGCSFMAGYPISPATEILEQLISVLPERGGQALQTEDEIAAITMAIGASFGGAKAMTATSGPGLSLMAEGLGLAVATELPLLVVDVQRVGPSTGIPSRTEQSDLNLALYGRHGDAPLPVIAPVSIADCQLVARQAMELAQDFSTPVVLLSDQLLAQSLQTVDPADLASEASASKATELLARPGNSNLTGLVTAADGSPTSDPARHAELTAAREAKLQRLLDVAPVPALYKPTGFGDQGPARLGLLTWGSAYGVCCAAADQLAQRGHVVSVLAPRLLFPLDGQSIQRWWCEMGAVAVVELNSGGQFWRLLQSHMQLPANCRSIRRAGGRPYTAEELLVKLQELLG